MKSISELFDEPLFDKKKENRITVMPRPYSRMERVNRIMLSNSSSFDRESYAADGGKEWIDPRRELFFDRDKAKDKALWDRAVKESVDALGREEWQMVVWLYKKLGGKF